MKTKKSPKKIGSKSDSVFIHAEVPKRLLARLDAAKEVDKRSRVKELEVVLELGLSAREAALAAGGDGAAAGVNGKGEGR